MVMDLACNTQTLRTSIYIYIIHADVTLDMQCAYYMPPFEDMKPVCQDCHKIVPEFILIPYDVDGNHIGTFTDVKPAGKFCL